jgi:hypothetical protein
VSASPALDVCPAITCYESGLPCIVWQSKAVGNWNICASLYDGGAWRPPILVDSNGGYNLNPVAAGSVGTATWVVWQDYQAGWNWEVYAKSMFLSGVSEGPARVLDRLQLTGVSNPCIGRAKLSYALGRAGSGRLAVYDRQGRLVLDLGTVRGSGALRCPELAPGVYFARLSTRSELAETKLVLTR